MNFYNKPIKQTLVDLINESNPNLPFPITTTDYEFMPPESITELPNGHNTKIRLYCKESAPYVGNVELTYRRLNLGLLFKNVTPIVQKWIDTSGHSDTSHVMNLHDILDLYSEKYGINLDPSEINNYGLDKRYGDHPMSYGFPLGARNDSLVYVGSVTARWDLGERRLESLLGGYEVNGRLYPDGNDFSTPETRKDYITPSMFHVDFTSDYLANTSDWNYTSYPMGGTTSARYVRMFNLIIAAVKREWSKAYPDKPEATYTHNNRYDYRNNESNFSGFYIRQYTLPHPNVPEANSEFFNSVIVLETPDDCDWASGHLYLHYNRI